MERLNDDAQWIVLMGFVISIAIFFLAILEPVGPCRPDNG